MPLVHQCARAGCSTLTMGSLCLEHEAPDEPQRRGFPLVALALAGLVAGFVARARLHI